jgi:hypothetical protein
MESAEQRIETAMRILFDLDGSSDAATDATLVMRMARTGHDRTALTQALRTIQGRFDRRIDDQACERMADVVLSVAATHGLMANT